MVPAPGSQRIGAAVICGSRQGALESGVLLCLCWDPSGSSRCRTSVPTCHRPPWGHPLPKTVPFSPSTGEIHIISNHPF